MLRAPDRGGAGRWLALCIAAAVILPTACNRDESLPETEVVCSEAFYRIVDAKLQSGDGEGHGPDIGSDEWKSVVEFKLGIRGDADVPSRDGDDWCRYIDRTLSARPESVATSAKPVAAKPAAGPSFDCGAVEAGGIEAMICDDEALSTLDRKLAEVYAAASDKATNEHPPRLTAEQRGWLEGRDECWKSDDERECVRAEYERRIAELQARYRLVSFAGPVRFVCDGNPANEVVASYFRTDPPTLIAERGDSVSLMFLERSGSGSRYRGRNESLWEHQGEATIIWGYGAPEMQCKKAP